jgi:hypothetical protein
MRRYRRRPSVARTGSESDDRSGDSERRGRCVGCGEIIGLYEPALWATDDGRVVIASPLGVDPRDLRPSVPAHLHLACWNDLIGRPPDAREQ